MVENNRIYLDEDTRLMMKASKGDEKTYAVLYNKYFSAAARFVSSRNGQVPSAEDIAQEVFARVWENRAKYQPTAAFKTYLFGYAKIVLSERLKSQDKEAIVRNLRFSEDSVRSSAQTVQPEFKIEEDNIREVIRLAMSGLTAKQFRSVELVYYMNLPANKAAKVAGCSEKAFEKRLSRAHKYLRKALAAFEKGEPKF